MFRVLFAVSLLLRGLSFAQDTSSSLVLDSSAAIAKTAATDTSSASQPSTPQDSKSLTLFKSAPVIYPEAAQNAGIQGYVVVKITTNETGDVESTSVVSGDPTLTAAALTA